LYVVARSISAKTVGLSTSAGGTANASFTYASGQQIVLSDGWSSNSYGKEMDGMRNISAQTTNTLHGIDRSTAANAFFRPVTDTSASSVSEVKLMSLADNVAASGQAEVDVFLTTRGIRRGIATAMQANRRYNDANSVKLEGGYTSIMVNDIPIVIDDDCPKGFAFAINKAAFKWFELAKPGFLEQDSGIFTLKDGSTSGTKQAIWQAFFRWYAAFGCVAPNRTGALTSLTDEDPV
jgi:hypothetical protein